MDQEGLHREALWIYGVLVALVVEQALVRTIPDILTPPSGTDVTLEVWRLLIVLLVAVRLYLGAVVYFGDVHGPKSSYKRRSFGLDFLTGFFHFLFLFAWATTVNHHARMGTLRVSWFLLLLSWILAFDLLWVLLSIGYDSLQRIKLWTAVNTATVLLALIVLLAWPLFGFSPGTCEVTIFILVGIVSIVDLSEIVRRQPVFAPLIARLLPTLGPN